MEAASNLLKSYDHKERRLSARVTPDPLLIIRLPAGNQGIVLDVSHEGVGFLASVPIDDAQTIRFEISPRSTRGSEAIGQLMWKDRSGTRGGLKFTHLPEELRTIIRSFIPREQPPPALRIEPEALGSDVLKPEEPKETLPLVSRINSGMWKLAANSLTTALACLIVLAVWYSVDRSDALASLSRLKRQMPTSFSMHMNGIPHWWTALAKSTQTPPASPSVAKAPVTQSAASNTPVDAPLPDRVFTDGALPGVAPPDGVALPDKEQPVPTEVASSAETPVMPATNLMNADGRETEATEDRASIPASPALKDQGQTQLTLARTLLQENSDPANQTKAVQLLWQAVQKGNVAAEVELGSLYLEGQAVSKSCSQALVLLTAARSHKNALAEQKLSDLPEYGCESAGNTPNPPSSESIESTQ